MDTAIEAIRPVSKVRGRQGSRYTAAQRKQFVVKARKRRAEGVGLLEAAHELGVSAESLRRWGLSQAKGPRLRPVTTAPASATVDTATLRLITSSGHQVEGLDVGQLIAVVRALA